MPRVSSQKVRQALLTVGLPIADPTQLPEQFQLYDEDGEPLTLNGYPREIREHVTPVIAALESALSVLTVYSGWRGLKVQTDIPARIRIYASAAQRLADIERPIGQDPRGNHGLLFELVTIEEQLIYTLSPKVDFATDDEESSDYYVTVTNLSDAPGAVTTTYYLLRTEQ